MIFVGHILFKANKTNSQLPENAFNINELSTVSEGGGAINKFHLGTVVGSRVKLHSGKRLAQLCRLQLTGG